MLFTVHEFSSSSPESGNMLKLHDSSLMPKPCRAPWGSKKLKTTCVILCVVYSIWCKEIKYFDTTHTMLCTHHLFTTSAACNRPADCVQYRAPHALRPLEHLAKCWSPRDPSNPSEFSEPLFIEDFEGSRSPRDVFAPGSYLEKWFYFLLRPGWAYSLSIQRSHQSYPTRSGTW